MAETILSIREASWDNGGRTEGYEIITSEQVIRIGVDAYQACCESWGYVISEDDIAEFIGAEILSIRLTDTALNTKIIEGVDSLDAGDAMLVTVETNIGPLQFAVYNAHNGYYGHEAVIESRQLTESKII